MKMTMKYFFDGSKEELRTDIPSTERIKALTMEKINQSVKPKRSVSRIVGIAAAIAIILTVSVAVYAARDWTGFMQTEKLSEQELSNIMEMIAHSGCAESTDSDGNTHYFDSYGNEIMVLSPSEVKQFEQAKERARADRCQAGAGEMLNVDTLDLMPVSITPVETDQRGRFADFLLANGNMALLHPKSDAGYQLKKGDTVTISLNATEACIVLFGVVFNGEMVEETAMKSQSHEFEYTVPEDGRYNFTLMYTSVDADNFTDCTINIE